MKSFVKHHYHPLNPSEFIQSIEFIHNFTQLVQRIKTTVQYLPELYNPETKDFLIIETDASDSTWAGCMKAILNGKKKLGLDIDGIPIPQSNLSEISIDG